MLLRNEILATDGLAERGPADDHEVKRLGDHPLIFRVKAGSATVEIAIHEEDRDLVVGPYRGSGERSIAARARAYAAAQAE